MRVAIRHRCCAIVLAAVAATCAPAIARQGAAHQDSPRELVVGVKRAPPFVIGEPGGYGGLAVELWEETARENGWHYRYREYDLAGLLDAVASGKVDIAIGAITTTAKREARMDFSHPLTSSGLAIAVRNEWVAGWFAVVRAVFSAGFLKVIGALGLILLVVGWLAWLFEHRRNPEQFGGTRASGVFSGVWWAMVTMTTVGYGDVAPRTVGGRLLGLAWMLTALVIVSFFTAAITSTLTVGQLNSQVGTAEDLEGMRIGSVAGSTSTAWLKSRHLPFTDSADLEAALQQLADGRLDVVVYDAPLLQWTIRQQFAGQLRVLPIMLEREDYAFALPPGSRLREPVNASLLRRITAADWRERVAAYLGGG